MSILNMLRQWFVEDVDPAASALYAGCVAAARQPAFYAKHAVPDTVDGRFDLLLLHVTLAMLRIADRKTNQRLFDLMFADMDRSLREMGVGDMSIGKKMKPMLAGFYGRAAAYKQALAKHGDSDLVAALSRNLYGLASGNAGKAPDIARYVRACAAALNTQDDADLRLGKIKFPFLG